MPPMSIYLSPSTQEKNIGAGSYGTEERRMNELTDLIAPALSRYGLTVYRNKPQMSLKEVVQHSNSLKPGVHLAIHSNAANTKARGCEIFCHRFGGQGEKLARAIYKEIEPITPTGDRGVKEGANFYGQGRPLYELAYTTAPAALIEVAFHDNPDDAKWILDNMQKIADAIVRGVCNFFNISDNPSDMIQQYKKIIQEKCNFSDPQGVWDITDTHRYALEFYRKWANSYLNKSP